MPVIDHVTNNADNHDDHYKTLMERQTEVDRNYDTLRDYNSILIECTVAIQGEDGGTIVPWEP